MKRVVFVMGPPGSGKGTQAELVSGKFKLFHFDSGRILEDIFHFSGEVHDPELQKERELFDAGKLNSPVFVLKKFKERVAELDTMDMGIIFSGSPRTEYEAFDGKEGGGLVDELETRYGKDAITVCLLEVPEEVSVQRNSNRMLCSVCGSPILSIEGIEVTRCPFCAGELRKRVLDNPETMKTRLNEYHERTEPVLKGLEERGHTINRIDGSKLPFEVFEQIKEVMGDR
jgi:adenylate kinase